MNTYNRMLRALLCSGVLAVLLVVHGVTLKANACAGSHGIYTHILCNGDTMTGEGAYISSPDGHYRMYISAGDLVVEHDGNFSFVFVDAGHQGYQAGWVDDPATTCTAARLWNSSGSQVGHSGADVGPFICNNSNTYLKMDNDGCLRVYNFSDSYIGFDEFACG